MGLLPNSSSPPPPIPTLLTDPPSNGLKGLKHWRADFMAGLVVAMVSAPFSIGVAIASGAPPVTGITSAIIAGFILPFIGGSYVTISGPAAGLAPALYAGMMTMGAGSLEAGYPMLLPLICLAGLVQIALSRTKIAHFASMFPSPVVHGMLAAIGLLIIAKQLPSLMGVKFSAHEFWPLLFEVPKHIGEIQPVVAALAIFSLACIGLTTAMKKDASWKAFIQPYLVTVCVGTFVGWVLQLDPSLRIHIPENPLTHGIVFPDFQGVLNSPGLWASAFLIILTLTFIDGIESLATINAVDKIDPYKRQSDPDRTLLAMGVSNIASSLLGGLTIIPGGVKSTTCIVSGGRTQWANFYNACFLLLFLLCFRDVMNWMPYGVLGAVLVATGYKLCRPSLWRRMAAQNTESLILFSTTIFLTLTIDLLWGILGGTFLSILLNGLRIMKTIGQGGAIKALFHSPLQRQSQTSENTWEWEVGPALVATNVHHLLTEISRFGNSTPVQISLKPASNFVCIDTTAQEQLSLGAQRFQKTLGITLEWSELLSEFLSNTGQEPVLQRPLGVSQ